MKETFHLFKALVRFVASPDPGLVRSHWNGRTVWQVAMLGFIVLFAGSFIHHAVNFIFNEQVLAPQEAENRALIKQIPNWLIFIFACFIGPVGEELFVRLPLKPKWVYIPVSMIAGVGMLLLFNQLAVAKWYTQQPFILDTNRLIPVGIIALIAVAYYALPQRYQQHPLCFAIFLYSTAFVFAVLHRFDRIHEPIDVLLAFKDTLIQFTSGLYYAFIRMKFGIRLAIISHSIWNFLPAVFRFL